MRTESTQNIINFEQVKPTEPIAPYLGGKRLLAKTIYIVNRLWAWAECSSVAPKSQNVKRLMI